uniref:8-amino-7-oxononanoate synthase n=1 Tax=Thaumasiovibrio occultus TaxID=1891184 RepID=UPI000B35E361|nr:8-amino-7-oxononanoate synthase [Thaumasiovibrio occultus]
MSIRARIDAALDERRQSQLLREHRLYTQGSAINFSSNDYLGLSQAPEVKQAFADGIRDYGSGSGASPLVSGYYPAHQALTAQLCEWTGMPRALLFNSGFAANQAVLFCLLQKGDVLLQDKLNHASLQEAGMLSPATQWRFRHNDVGHLTSLVARHSPQLIITEGVFSMDGDIAPLENIAEHKGNALLMVDDAHAAGVLGEEGRGSETPCDIKVITFGKALGVAGAAVLCDESIYEYLLQFARHYTYSTAMPPAQACAISTAVTLARKDQWRRDRLHELSELFYHELAGSARAIRTATPIKPVVYDSIAEVMSVAERLNQHGMRISAIRPPTVPTPRLRITLTALHSDNAVKQLCQRIKQGE